MFHLFTLQGKRIDAQLEHLPKNIRVHHTKSNNRIKKYEDGSSSGSTSAKKSPGSYGEEAYRDAVRMEYDKSPVFHASEIMSTPVFTIGPDVYVEKAWSEFMDKKVHHMPVVSEDGEILGIVSDRDLLKKLIISNGKIETARDSQVSDIMSTDVIATTPLTDIRRIAKAMLDHHIDAMPIVDDNGLIVGIITRSDILYAIIHHTELKLWG